MPLASRMGQVLNKEVVQLLNEKIMTFMQHSVISNSSENINRSTTPHFLILFIVVCKK
jgi:hypothetical protein